MRDGTELAREKAEARRKLLADIRRRRRFRFGVVLAGIFAVLFAAFQLYNSHLFDIKEIRVVGNHRLSSADVVRISGARAGSSLLRTPTGPMRDRLLANPWVERATVNWRPLSTLELIFTERSPAAIVAADGSFYVVDRSAFAIAKVPGTEGAAVPVIADVEGVKVKIGKPVKSAAVTNALAALGALDPTVRRVISLVSAPAPDKLSFFTSDDIEIVYGGINDADLKNKVLLRLLREGKGKLVRIDIRSASNPVVTRVETAP